MKGRGWVMLADDSTDDAALVQRAFRPIEDLELVHASDGKLALDILLETQLPPRLLILDLKMPMVDGFEVLRRLPPTTRDYPIIVMSSSDEPRDLKRAQDLGCDGYVVKPVDYTEFVAAVRGLLTRHIPA